MASAQNYDFLATEKKWQNYWYKHNIFAAKDNDKIREKKYILVEFPFPSGESLHVGHCFRYTVPDIYARYLRMKGYNVLFPMGWDAFGLPTEERARKEGISPQETTKKNIANLKNNIQRMGYSVDWSREFSTTDPEYYKWTQWIFTEFYKAGLAEQKDIELWWCEDLGTVLANEEVYEGSNGYKLSERGGYRVEKRKMKQWVLDMPSYAKKLLEGLEETDFPEFIKAMQRQWIGKSEGLIMDWELVPREYIKLLESYPIVNYSFRPEESVAKFDSTKIIRERSTILLRVKETGQFVSFRRQAAKDTEQDFLYLPGGAVDFGETPLLAGIRELKEELGIENVEYVTDLGSVNSIIMWDSQQQRSVSHYFLCEVSQNDIVNRLEGEVDIQGHYEYGDLEITSIEKINQNNWEGLDKIVKNYQEFMQTGKITAVQEQNRDIVLGTTNSSKIRRYKNHLNFNGINLLTPMELGVNIDVLENGKTELENASIKARAFWEVTKKPSLGLDTGVYLEGVPTDQQPGEKTKRIAGVLDTDSPEERFEKMISYYIGLVNKYGINCELEGYFLDSYVLYDGLTEYQTQAKREIILTNKVNDRKDLDFPMCSIYKTLSSGVYHNELSIVQEMEFLKPSMDAVKSLVFGYIFDGESAGGLSSTISTFTTRVDTLPSTTFLVVSPEYPNLLELASGEYKLGVANYIEQSRNKSERERQIAKDKTGVFTGRFVKHPISGLQLPVWCADFVLGGYGTGAVMGNAHDERDSEFAKKFGIYLKENISEDGKQRKNWLQEKPFTENGILYDSGEFDGLTGRQARTRISDWLVGKNLGQKQTNYRMRDFVFSRQRYWGEPFPIEYDNDGNIRILEKNELPLELPIVADYEPSKNGESPLEKTDWIHIYDESGNIIGKHEADTMPNWAGSNWYFTRFTDPKNTYEFASMENMKYWLPVDNYFGGGEHTTMHLLYSRFVHKFLYDRGLVPTSEPFKKRHNGGILLGPDGSKMSKSKGNVVQPNEKLDSMGADALRLYIAFIGPYDGTVTWQDNGLKACKTVVDRIWNLQEKIRWDYNVLERVGELNKEEKSLVVAYHKFVKNITSMLEEMRNNVAVSEIMSFSNLLKDQSEIPEDIWLNFVLAIAPFIPHISEELAYLVYVKKGGMFNVGDEELRSKYGSLHLDLYFPHYDPTLVVDDEVTMVVQINGKVRSEFLIAKNAPEEEVLEQAKVAAAKWLEGKEIKFSKIVPGKLVTLVVG